MRSLGGRGGRRLRWSAGSLPHGSVTRWTAAAGSGPGNDDDDQSNDNRQQSGGHIERNKKGVVNVVIRDFGRTQSVLGDIVRGGQDIGKTQSAYNIEHDCPE